jgi:hypothetical protein
LSASWSGVIALDDVDAERRELRAHRRIDVAIRSGHAMAALARERGNATHEGSTDAENVQVQGQLPTGTSRDAMALSTKT